MAKCMLEPYKQVEAICTRWENIPNTGATTKKACHLVDCKNLALAQKEPIQVLPYCHWYFWRPGKCWAKWCDPLRWRWISFGRPGLHPDGKEDCRGHCPQRAARQWSGSPPYSGTWETSGSSAKRQQTPHLSISLLSFETLKLRVNLLQHFAVLFNCCELSICVDSLKVKCTTPSLKMLYYYLNQPRQLLLNKPK